MLSRAIFREKLIIIIYILWLRDIKYIYTYIFLREESAQTVADPSDLSDNRMDASRARRIRIDRNEENLDPLCFFFLSFVSWFSFSSFEFIWFNIKMELTACEYFWLLGEKKTKKLSFFYLDSFFLSICFLFLIIDIDGRCCHLTSYSRFLLSVFVLFLFLLAWDPCS